MMGSGFCQHLKITFPVFQGLGKLSQRRVEAAHTPQCYSHNEMSTTGVPARCSHLRVPGCVCSAVTQLSWAGTGPSALSCCSGIDWDSPGIALG